MTTHLVAGVDESGRGPLAGPVVAAAVILPADHGIEGLTDSKLLAPPVRESLAASIRIRASAWAVARVSPEEIDEINILQATMRAMQCALAALAPAAHSALIDGDRCPELPIPARAVVGGDISEAAISAASILAKVVRDTEMIALDERFPGYGFASHKGYATPEHRAALARLGPCEIHRHSFAPVRAAVNMAADD